MALFRVIPNATLMPFSFETVMAAVREDDLIFAGGDDPKKGAFDVLHVWTALQRHGFAGRLHWFGSVGDTFFKDKIAELPGFGNILVYGRTKRSELFAEALKCKVLLMLSQGEPFGMVTVECASAGCLAVAWDVDAGTKEILPPGEAFYVPYRDYDEAARAVIQACRDHAARYGAMTARIHKDYCEERMWGQYSSLIDDVMVAPPAYRPLAGQVPPQYVPPWRFSHALLSARARAALRHSIAHYPRLSRLVTRILGR